MKLLVRCYIKVKFVHLYHVVVPTLAPPSYVQSVFGKVDIRDDGDEHTRGDLNYAPVYPYYNWDNEAYSLPVQSAPDS